MLLIIEYKSDFTSVHQNGGQNNEIHSLEMISTHRNLPNSVTNEAWNNAPVACGRVGRCVHPKSDFR